MSEYDESCFTGLASLPIRGEGAPMHPDDPNCPVMDEESERRQAFLYFDYYNGHEGLRFYEEWLEQKINKLGLI